MINIIIQTNEDDIINLSIGKNDLHKQIYIVIECNDSKNISTTYKIDSAEIFYEWLLETTK